MRCLDLLKVLLLSVINFQQSYVTIMNEVDFPTVQLFPHSKLIYMREKQLGKFLKVGQSTKTAFYVRDCPTAFTLR